MEGQIIHVNSYNSDIMDKVKPESNKVTQVISNLQ